MTTISEQTQIDPRIEFFAPLRKHLNDDDWRLASILLKLLWHERFDSMHPEPSYRWLQVLHRLLDARSPSSERVAELLSEIEVAANREMPRRSIVGSTLPSDDIFKATVFLHVLDTLGAVRARMPDANNSRQHSLHHDFVGLRYYLGDDDFAFLLQEMWTTPEETSFSWWDEFKIWFGRTMGFNIVGYCD